MKESSSNRGFLILSAAGIITKIISVFYIPLLQRIIGLSGYGIYQNCYEVFLFAYAVTNLGTQPAIAKVVAEYTARERPEDAVRTLRISRSLLALISGIISIGLMAGAFLIGKGIKNPDAAYGILMLAPSIFVTTILSSYRGYFQGRNSMTAIAVSQVVEQIINIGVSLLCAYLLIKISIPYGAAGGTIGTSVGALLALGYIIVAFRREDFEEDACRSQVKKKIRSKRIIRKLIKYGLPITLSSGLQNFGSLVDMINVNARLAYAGFSMEKSQELYGVLGRYKTLLNVPLIIITALGATVLPAVSAAVAVKNRKEVRQKTSFAFRMVFLITIPAAVGLSCLSKEIFVLLYGSEEGYNLMMIGAIVLVFMAVAQIQTVLLQSMNKLYYVLTTFIIGLVFKIGANFILVGMPKINIMGVVAGNFLWFFIPCILNISALRKVLKVRINLIKNAFKPLIASIAMALVIYFAKKPIDIILDLLNYNYILYLVTTIILIVLGALVYVYVLSLINGLKKKDMDSISPRIYRMLPRFIRENME